jgi:hypothetical protein
MEITAHTIPIRMAIMEIMAGMETAIVSVGVITHIGNRPIRAALAGDTRTALTVAGEITETAG